MAQDARAHALKMLRTYRTARVEHDLEGDRLRAESVVTIETARAADMTWDEVAEFLGYSNGHALRMWHAREQRAHHDAEAARYWRDEADL
jgi:hypothetical protein